MKKKKKLSNAERIKKLKLIKQAHSDGRKLDRNRRIVALFNKLNSTMIYKPSVRALLESLKAQFYSKGTLTNIQYKTLLKIVDYERNGNRIDYKY